MDELPQGLESLLSDPETMARLTRMAQQLMGGSPGEPPAAKKPTPAGPALPGALGGLLHGEVPERRALAAALGPYLGEERGRRLSRALGMAAAVRLAGGVLKGEGGHGL